MRTVKSVVAGLTKIVNQLDGVAQANHKKVQTVSKKIDKLEAERVEADLEASYAERVAAKIREMVS